MAARLAKTQQDAVASEPSDDSSASSSDESESEPEDDPYDEAFTSGKGMPRGLWEHGRINAFGKRPRAKCAGAKESSRKSGPRTRSRVSQQKSDAATSSTSNASSSTTKIRAMPVTVGPSTGTRTTRAAAGLPSQSATPIGGPVKKGAAGVAISFGCPHAKSTTTSAPADAPTERFEEFLVSKDLVDAYLEYSTTISTSRKDFLRAQGLLKEWIAFNP